MPAISLPLRSIANGGKSALTIVKTVSKVRFSRRQMRRVAIGINAASIDLLRYFAGFLSDSA
jgi:hypothetical protein